MAPLYQLEDQMGHNLKKLNNQGPLGRVKKQSLLRALLKNQNAELSKQMSTQNEEYRNLHMTLSEKYETKQREIEERYEERMERQRITTETRQQEMEAKIEKYKLLRPNSLYNKMKKSN